jgi:hypothetical protein
MTPAQFELVAELIRSTEPVRSVAKFVLVEGQSNAKAREWTDVSPQSQSNTLTRFRKAHKDIVEVYQAATGGNQSDGEMTMSQFELVANLIRSRDPVREAAMHVLVGGWTNQRATEGTEITRQGIWNAVHRFRVAHAKIQKAYGKPARSRKTDATAPA